MIKISERAHLNGMPVMKEVVINFGDIGIEITKETHLELATAIGEKAASDVAKAQEIYEKYWARVKKMSDFAKAIRDVFYDGDDDLFIMREYENIDTEKLDSILNDNAHLLGLE